MAQTSYSSRGPLIEVLFVVVLVAGSVFAVAQGVPPPEEVLGFKVGADYRMATYEQAVEYLQALEKASTKIKLFDMGPTSMGKPMIYAIITSQENMERLDHFKNISKRLALVDGLDDQQARSLAREGKAVVYIEAGVHADEPAPPQSHLQLAFDLVTSDDRETRLVLDNVIALLVFPNPDGMQMISEWYSSNVGTPYEISTMPWLYHKYAGHDNNRDTFMGNLIETQHIVELVNREWLPVIFHSHHQTAPFPARIWVPPSAEPSNPNTHPLFIRGRNLIGAHMGFDFDQQGKPGTISRVIHSFWYAGYMDWFFGFFNVVATLTETALYRYATPHFYSVEDFPEEYKDFTVGNFYPNPWKGGWWRFHDAVDYCVTASKSLLHTAALFREQFLYAKYQMGRDTAARFEGEPPYAWIVPRAQPDPPVAARMLNWLIHLGIEVYEAEETFEVAGSSYPAGTWILPMNQPFALSLKAIFEEQNYPDMAQHPALWQGIVNPQKSPNAYHPPFDTAGWTLQYQMGVQMAPAGTPLKIGLKAIDKVELPPGKVAPSAQHAYLISPDRNNHFIAVNRILKEGAPVRLARESFQVKDRRYPPGTAIISAKGVSRSLMESLAGELSLGIGGSPEAVKADAHELGTARVALYQSWVPNMGEGWTRWLLEQYEFSFSNVRDAEVRAGSLGKKFDVLILPSMQTKTLLEGHKKGTIPPQYVGGIGDKGVRSIKRFVAEGGTLVTLNAASLFAVERLGLPVTNVLKDLGPPVRTLGPDLSAEPPKFACPGSVLRMKLDPSHPVAYGMPEEIGGMFMRSPAFEVVYSEDGEEEFERNLIVAKYPGDNLLMSGYLKGEQYLRNKAAVVEVPLENGRVILLGFATQNRAQSHATFKLLFNSIYLGAISR